MNQRPRPQWYRWDGVYTADFTLEALRVHAWQLSDAITAHQWSALIAYDTRFLSVAFARYVYQLLEQRGVNVGFSATAASVPMVELALERRRFDCVVLIGAGNLPNWFNGLAALAPFGNQNPFEALGTPGEALPLLAFPPEPLPASEQTQIDIRTPAIEMLRSAVDIDLIRRSTLTIFADPMNGTTSGLVPTIIGEGAQTRAIEINREADPQFSRQTPLPSEATMNRIRKLVKESDSHLGASMSADGRVLGVTDNTGELATPFELALLLAEHLSRHHRLRGAVIVPAGSTAPGLASWENAHNLKVEAAADPAARIAEFVANDRNGLLVGMTALGEATIGRYSASADATLAALLLTEMLAVSGKKLRAVLDELRTRLQA